jgi:DeoR family transcriptional regulator, fructose operon transcriptional repressor
VLAAERKVRILEELRGARMVSTEDLARSLNVSGETIRRDLVGLEQQGLLSRVHGGAAAAQSRPAGQEPSFAERAASGSEAKDLIGRVAASLVRPGQLIVIDVGTTAARVARALPTDLVATVATCSLLAAIELADRPNLEVLVCGGRLRGGDLALSNTLANSFFADLRPDIAFLGSGGVDAQSGLTDFHLDEAVVRRTIIGRAATSYALADATKFDRVAHHRVAGWNALSGLITDAEPPASMRESITAAGGRVLVG